LKFLGPDISASAQAKASFLVEAKAASGLDSPHICTIHEISETESGEMFIVMSLYEGQTLKERIADGKLPPADRIWIMRVTTPLRLPRSPVDRFGVSK
jgi:serine/threonine-protein kinase